MPATPLQLVRTEAASGREVKRLQQTEMSPVAYDTKLRITVFKYNF